jgi:hypothetical protein
VHKGFGRAAAWQFWFMLGQAALPRPNDPYTEEDDASAGQEVTSTLLLEVFESTWELLQVCTQAIDAQC